MQQSERHFKENDVIILETESAFVKFRVEITNQVEFSSIPQYSNLFKKFTDFCKDQSNFRKKETQWNIIRKKREGTYVHFLELIQKFPEKENKVYLYCWIDDKKKFKSTIAEKPCNEEPITKTKKKTDDDTDESESSDSSEDETDITSSTISRDESTTDISDDEMNNRAITDDLSDDPVTTPTKQAKTYENKTEVNKGKLECAKNLIEEVIEDLF